MTPMRRVNPKLIPICPNFFIVSSSRPQKRNYHAAGNFTSGRLSPRSGVKVSGCGILLAMIRGEIRNGL
jgi:hypothetical protein